jgi:hypothetical protein
MTRRNVHATRSGQKGSQQNGHESGHALMEFLVVSVALLPLFLLIPVIAKYQSIAYATQIASRYAAFDGLVRNDGSSFGVCLRTHTHTHTAAARPWAQGQEGELGLAAAVPGVWSSLATGPLDRTAFHTPAISLGTAQWQTGQQIRPGLQGTHHPASAGAADGRTRRPGSGTRNRLSAVLE